MKSPSHLPTHSRVTYVKVQCITNFTFKAWPANLHQQASPHPSSLFYTELNAANCALSKAKQPPLITLPGPSSACKTLHRKRPQNSKWCGRQPASAGASPAAEQTLTSLRADAGRVSGGVKQSSSTPASGRGPAATCARETATRRRKTSETRPAGRLPQHRSGGTGLAAQLPATAAQRSRDVSPAVDGCAHPSIRGSPSIRPREPVRARGPGCDPGHAATAGREHCPSLRPLLMADTCALWTEISV